VHTQYWREADFYLLALRKISSRFNGEFPEDRIHIRFTKVHAVYVKAAEVGKVNLVTRKIREQKQSGRFTVSQIGSVEQVSREFLIKPRRQAKRKKHELRAPSTSKEEIKSYQCSQRGNRRPTVSEKKSIHQKSQ
jgi:hypothetical protein